MNTKLVKKKNILKHQTGGVTKNIVTSEKSPKFSQLLQTLGSKLNQEQAKATALWQAANPTVPVKEFLERASKPGFGNAQLDSTFNALSQQYGDKTIPMSPEYSDLEAQYTNLTNKIRGLPMSSTGTKEDTITKKVGYRTLLKRYPREVGETPYQYLTNKL